MLISGKSLWVGSTVVAFLSNAVQSRDEMERGKAKRRILLSDDWKDVFVAGAAGRPTLGTTGATCWARGGVCVDIRECPGLRFDGNVPGCMKGFKVCCKIARQLSPTVGQARKSNDIPIFSSNLEELDHEMLRAMGQHNFNYLGMVAITDN